MLETTSVESDVNIFVRVDSLHIAVIDYTVFELSIKSQAIGELDYTVTTHYIICEVSFEADRLSDLVGRGDLNGIITLLLPKDVNKCIFAVIKYTESVLLIILPSTIVKIIGLMISETAFALLFTLNHIA